MNNTKQLRFVPVGNDAALTIWGDTDASGVCISSRLDFAGALNISILDGVVQYKDVNNNLVAEGGGVFTDNVDNITLGQTNSIIFLGVAAGQTGAITIRHNQGSGGSNIKLKHASNCVLQVPGDYILLIKIATNWVELCRNVAGDVTTVHATGIIDTDDATDSSSGTTGSIHTDGGLGVAKKAFFGDTVTVPAITTNAIHYSNVVQEVFSSTQTVSSLYSSAAMPWDNTVPQNTEGIEVLTVSITPSSATSKLKIEANVIMAVSAGELGILALFRDSGADALSVALGGFGFVTNVMLVAEVDASSTSTTTFKIRAGDLGAGWYLNSSWTGGVTANMGGKITSWIKVTEIRV